MQHLFHPKPINMAYPFSVPVANYLQSYFPAWSLKYIHAMRIIKLWKIRTVLAFLSDSSAHLPSNSTNNTDFFFASLTCSKHPFWKGTSQVWLASLLPLPIDLNTYILLYGVQEQSVQFTIILNTFLKKENQ